MEKKKGVTFLQLYYWVFISPSGILLFKRKTNKPKLTISCK